MSFVPDFKNSIPGYTGHKQEQLNVGEQDLQQAGVPRKQIPGMLFIYYFLCFISRLLWIYSRNRIRECFRRDLWKNQFRF